MYYSTDSDQLIIEDFAMPFSGSLDPNNRWVKLSRIMPWDHIEQIYNIGTREVHGQKYDGLTFRLER